MTDDAEPFVVPADLRDVEAPAGASLADRERTFWLGLGAMAAGFGLAEFLHSLTWLPLGLVIPGAILTVLALFSMIGGEQR